MRFTAERDSLDATVLGPDAGPGTPEFELFVKEVVREMTTKAGQKCTAIRCAFVPAHHLDAAEAAIAARLGEVAVGEPQVEGVTMGALASMSQLEDVRAKARELQGEARLAFGAVDAKGVEPGTGAFSPLRRSPGGPRASSIHSRRAGARPRGPGRRTGWWWAGSRHRRC